MSRLISRVVAFLLLVCVLLLSAEICTGDIGIQVSVMTGAPLNLNTPLKISQDGYPDLELTARYKTRPFESAYYYGLSFARWHGNDGWSIDMLHHKLYLDNPPPEVQYFSVSHGHNLVTLRRLWNRSGNIFSLGGGVVITHPESCIRNRHFDEYQGFAGKGFYLSGPAVDGGIGRHIRLNDRLFLSAEFRTTLSYVSVPIVDGDAKLSNVAFHFIVGLGGNL
jgi:hypothetical protein